VKLKKKSEKRRNRYLLLAFLAVGALLFYAFFVFEAYTEWMVYKMKTVFREITDMDLTALEEEDEGALQDYYQDDRIEIRVADETLLLIYSNRVKDDQSESSRYITEHLDEYQEQPTVYIRKNKFRRLIRVRGLIRQSSADGQTQTYYVYLKQELHDTGAIICGTVVYFGVLFLLILWLWCLIRKTEKSEADLRKEREEISQEKLAQVQKEFVANVSHELKTPLAVISGQVEMLQSMGDQIDREYYFSSIREEIDKMSDMVGNLLNITSMERHLQEMEKSEVSLSDLVEYMVLKYEAMFSQNGIRLQTELERDCIVWGNQMYLEQALNNYIMNAFQHTAQGKMIGIRLVREQKSAAVYVYNEGPQIQTEEMERIWNDFYTAPEGRRYQNNRKMENAGLGLYLVKKIIEQHEGECGVKNVERGVEFWFCIPLV
jgi:signal transduction histidine kinase